MTFNELKENEPFTIYKKISSKRAEKREAIVIEKHVDSAKGSRQKSIVINLLSVNGRIAYGNYPSTWFIVREDDLNKSEWKDMFFLERPKNLAVIRKKTIIETA